MSSFHHSPYFLNHQVSLGLGNNSLSYNHVYRPIYSDHYFFCIHCVFGSDRQKKSYPASPPHTLSYLDLRWLPRDSLRTPSRRSGLLCTRRSCPEYIMDVPPLSRW